jgi:putative PEP-CTERM system TPR-repeat lipoprotein
VLAQALIARPGAVAALVELVQLDVADGKPDAARSRIEQALTHEPTNPDLLIAYAQWLQISGAPADRVRQQFERAVAAASNDPAARVALAKFHSRAGDNAQAAVVMQDAIAALPGNVVLLAQLGEVQARAGDLKAAAGTLSQAVEASGDDPNLLLALAEVQLRQEAVDAARATLRKVLANRAGHVPAVERLVELELRAKRPTEAIAAARELQQAVPREPAGYLLEAEVFARGGNWDAAIRVCRAAMKESDSPRFAVAIHRLLEQASRKHQAERFLAEWSASHPRDPTMQAYLAHAALARQDHAEATRLYRKLVNDFPSDVDALNNLAWLAHRSGDRSAAGYAERALRLAPSNPIVLDTLGWILVEQGGLNRGLALLRLAAARAPGNAEIRFNLARALLKAGNTGEARIELDRLARLGKAFSQHSDVDRLRAGL